VAAPVGIIETLPLGQLDRASRLVGALARADGRIRRHFLRIIQGTRGLADLEGVASLLQSGRVDAALGLLAGDLGESLATAVDQAYIAAGFSAAAALRGEIDTLLDFNMANTRAVNHLQQTRLRLVVGFNTEQRAATRIFLQDAFARGLSPIEQARALQRSIGLTQHQAQIIQNYRRDLQGRSRNALARQLRDKRFDPTVLRSIESGVDLTEAQIDRMVTRYEEKWIRFRAQTIAETESRAAAGAADEELWNQAIEQDVLPASALQTTWKTTRNPETVRDSHKRMEGQKRPFGVPFDSGLGNKLRYPGDQNAPGADTIRCQCVLERKVDQKAVAAHRQLQAAA
jgi:hypothetical protein